jgi:hypothetical protein
LTIRLRPREGVAKKILNNIDEFQFVCSFSQEEKEGMNYKFDITYENVEGYIEILEKGCNQILAVKLELNDWNMSLTLEDDWTLYALADQILMDQNIQVEAALEEKTDDDL